MLIFVSIILNGNAKSSMSRSIVRQFLGTAGLRIIGQGLGVITGIVFARLLGPEEFGRYSFSLSIVAILVLPTIAGLPHLLIREVATLISGSNQALLNGLIVWSRYYVIIISSLVIICVLLAIGLDFIEYDYKDLLLISLLLIPLRAGKERYIAMINAAYRPELAQLPAIILPPIVILFCASIGYISSIPQTAELLMWYQIISGAVSFIVGYLIVDAIFSKLPKVKAKDYESSKWRGSIIPFAIVIIISTMNNELATFFIGVLGNEVDVAYFRVAMQATTLLVLGQQAMNTVMQPRVARSYRNGEILNTQSLLKTSVRLSSLSSIPLALIFIIWGKEVINLLFGETYIPAISILKILCVGQIFNVCMGSVGMILNMTGNEKRTLRAQFITLISTLIGFYVLIPTYGGEGAAYSVSIGLIVWNSLMAVDVYRLTGLKPWLFQR